MDGYLLQSSVGEMLDEIEWPEGIRSSLLLFHKIPCGDVSIEKDKYMYMAPAHISKATKSLHNAQYYRY